MTKRVREALLLEDAELVLDPWVAEGGAQEEAVELRLREREGALVFDRVLGREEQERRGQVPGGAVDRNLVLGHRLEER
jgi:hypothetical protein